MISADTYNQTLPYVVVAEVTSNLANLTDPAHLHIEITTPDGAATGLLHDSLVSCVLLATIDADRVDRIIGRLSPSLLQKLDACLKVALNVQ